MTTDRPTATIIPFPSRSLPTPPVPVVERTIPAASPDLEHSAHRLTQALASLSAALADQKEATQRWRVAIEDLAQKMRSLGDGAAIRRPDASAAATRS